MLYKNTTEEKLGVETAIGSVAVKPGETVATSPKHAAPYLAAGQLALVEAEPKKTRRPAKETDS